MCYIKANAVEKLGPWWALLHFQEVTLMHLYMLLTCTQHWDCTLLLYEPDLIAALQELEEMGPAGD
jgi:hypothetical protein